MHKITICGATLDSATMAETVDWLNARIAQKEFTQHVVVNVAKIVSMQTDQQLAASIRACHLVNIDGMGVVWGARFLGKEVPERVAGIDLFHKLLALSAEKNYPVFLLGAKEEIVSKAAEVLHRQYPSLPFAGLNNGYFWENEQAVVEKIKASGARLLFVAITSPKKENFIYRWKEQLGVDFVMGVGGTFDVVAGKVKRAPLWMQQTGLEWLYRVIQEPGRMWKRYLVTNSKFVLMLLREKIKG